MISFLPPTCSFCDKTYSSAHDYRNDAPKLQVPFSATILLDCLEAFSSCTHNYLQSAEHPLCQATLLMLWLGKRPVQLPFQCFLSMVWVCCKRWLSNMSGQFTMIWAIHFIPSRFDYFWICCCVIVSHPVSVAPLQFGFDRRIIICDQL